MNFVKLMLMVVMISCPLFSQTLFEDTLKTSNNKPLTVNKSSAKSTKVSKKSTLLPQISTNLESVIIRGDIHFLYEIPQSKQWSSLLFIHANPQSTFNNETGDYGILYGQRMYANAFGISTPFFLQGMIGFNHYSSWDLFISLELGQRYQWTKSISFDVSTVINRSYSNDALDPMVYLKANISFTLDKPLFYFF